MFSIVQLIQNNGAVNTFQVKIYNEYESKLLKEKNVYFENNILFDTYITVKNIDNAINEVLEVLLEIAKEDMYFKHKLGTTICINNGTVCTLKEPDTEIINKFKEINIEYIKME